MSSPIRTIGHRPRARLLTACCALLIAASAGCQGTRPATQQNVATNQRSFTDGIGRTVAIKADPQRIISLAPNITETLFALGLGNRVVGVTSYCDFPAEAKTKEQVGDTIQPNLERIIALKPDLIVVTTSSQLEKLARQLDELKIPVYVTNPRSVREVVASIRSLGEVTGAGGRAEELAGEMDRRTRAVQGRVKDLPRPRVFYVLQNSPLITAGRNTFINDLINLAGGRSISGEETTDYPQFSRETVVARAPEVIVFPASHGTDLVNETDLRRDFTLTPAVRNNRLVRVTPDLVDRPGPRIVEGLEQLANALHPAGETKKDTAKP
ncbi:MAG TPA: cobalamin-binding protein [Blastocatellia bacterium]|nr:cobalamin-binding protein [Blastocatellia bacterium]